MSAAEILGLVFSAAAIAGFVYLGAAIWFVARLGGRPLRMSGSSPAVTILKPLHGAEPGLFDHLASFCAQAYPGPVQIVFGVQNPRDPAIDIVRQLQAAFPSADIELVVDARSHGSNRKVSNLVNMEEVARHEVIVLADSDMVAGPDYLSRVVGELERPGVGAVTCLYHGVGSGSLWSRCCALGIDTHFLPSVAVGIGLGLAKPCFGSTIALRRTTLEAIGGFRAFADDLADDYLVGDAVRRLGRSVQVTPFTIGHVCHQTSLSALLRQELRWVRTIRQVDPLGHAGSLLAHPLPLALAALCLLPGSAAFTMIGAAVALRIGLCLAVERAFGLRAHPYWLAPARDLLSFGIFVASFFGRGVSWRGHRYDVTPKGVLTAKDEALNTR